MQLLDCIYSMACWTCQWSLAFNILLECVQSLLPIFTLHSIDERTYLLDINWKVNAILRINFRSMQMSFKAHQTIHSNSNHALIASHSVVAFCIKWKWFVIFGLIFRTKRNKLKAKVQRIVLLFFRWTEYGGFFPLVILFINCAFNAWENWDNGLTSITELPFLFHYNVLCCPLHDPHGSKKLKIKIKTK